MIQEDKIEYPAGAKPISRTMSKDELVRTLKQLSTSLQEMESDEENVERFTDLALYLSDSLFLRHASKDVRVIVACCIADILRLFAPDKPYKSDVELKEVLIFFMKTLRGISDTSHANYHRYFYLLECLANTKCFELISESSDASTLTGKLFTTLFQTIDPAHTSKVKSNMLEIMCPLLSHSQCLSSDLLDLVCHQILEPSKSQKPAAYALASELLHLCSSNWEPLVLSFFNDVLIKDSDVDKNPKSSLLGRIYELMLELYRTAPSTMLSVLPQLELKLRSQDEKERLDAVSLLGKMFSEQSSQLYLDNNNLWSVYHSRMRDSSPAVRRQFLTHAAEIMNNHQLEVGGDVADSIVKLAQDLDPSVREEAIVAIGDMGALSFTLLNDELLITLQQRIRDTDWNVRQQSANCVGTLYKHMRAQLAEKSDRWGCESRFHKLSWAQDKLLLLYYNKNVEDKDLCERLLWNCLVDVTSEDVTNKFMQLYCSCEEVSVRVVDEILKNLSKLRVKTRELLECFDDDKAKISAYLQTTSCLFADPSKARESIKRFLHLLHEDKQLMKQFKRVLDPNCSRNEAVKSVKSILSSLGTSKSQQSFVESIKAFLEKLTSFVFDMQSVGQTLDLCIDLFRNPSNQEQYFVGRELASTSILSRGSKLILLLSESFSELFCREELFKKLLDLMSVPENSVVLKIVKSLIYLSSSSAIKSVPDHTQSQMAEVCESMIVRSNNPSLTKHSVRLLHTLLDEQQAFRTLSDLFEKLRAGISLDSSNVLGALSALGQIAYFYGHELHANCKSLVSNFVVKTVLMESDEERSSLLQTTSYDCEGMWCQPDDLHLSVKAKIRGMKLIVLWLCGLKDESNPLVGSTLRLLHTLISNEGDLMESGRLSLSEKAHLRLCAAKQMLELATVESYRESITNEQFQVMSVVMLDSCKEVRSGFANKLNKHLMSLKLNLQFLAILTLSAKDTDQHLHERHKKYILHNIELRRRILKTRSADKSVVANNTPDYVICFAIHLLAHHPEFDSIRNVTMLRSIKDCLWYLMETLMIRNESFSYSFFLRIFEYIKIAKDAQSPDDDDANDRLYAVTDLALTLLNSRSPRFEACPTVSTDRNIPIPARLFTRPDENATVNTRVYIPKQLMEPSKVLDSGKSAANAIKSRHRPAKASGNVKPRNGEIIEKSHSKDVSGDKENIRSDRKVNARGRPKVIVALKSPKVSSLGQKQKSPVPQRKIPRRAAASAANQALKSTELLESQSIDEDTHNSSALSTEGEYDSQKSPSLKRARPVAIQKPRTSKSEESDDEVVLTPRSKRRVPTPDSGDTVVVTPRSKRKPTKSPTPEPKPTKRKSLNITDSLPRTSTARKPKSSSSAIGVNQPRISAIFSRISPSGKISTIECSPSHRKDSSVDSSIDDESSIQTSSPRSSRTSRASFRSPSLKSSARSPKIRMSGSSVAKEAVPSMKPISAQGQNASAKLKLKARLQMAASSRAVETSRKSIPSNRQGDPEENHIQNVTPRKSKRTPVSSPKMPSSPSVVSEKTTPRRKKSIEDSTKGTRVTPKRLATKTVSSYKV